MLQPRRESCFSSTRRKRRHITTNLCRYSISSVFLIIIGCFTVVPQGLAQVNDAAYIVKPTPALQLGNEELTTVLLVNNDNDNHGRFINVRPEVGLLTSTARTFIQEGVTTEYATQVVGTTLNNGRVYAQYLKKSSRVLYDGGVVPSVVTSWVGESLKSDGLLPQSHNDLFDADQPDWQAIDDRLLGHRHDFVGNTDFVGIRDSIGPVPVSAKNEESKTLSWSSSSSTSSSNAKPLNIAGRFGVLEEDARKVAANKVLPIGDLPTYTIKQHYEPSAYSEVQNGDDEDDSGEAFGRNPKLIYKQLMLNNGKSENETTFSSQRPLTPPTRHLATVTYYGFADFTTIVGDSVIVFSPSTATNNMNLNAHVTYIKGEATLAAGVPQSQGVSTASITVIKDLIEPTLTQQISLISTLDVTTITPDTDIGTTEAGDAGETITEIPVNDTLEKEEGPETNTTILESSEVNVQKTESVMSSNSQIAAEASVMLSRPSDEEILRIYNALANAENDRRKVEMTTTASLTDTTVETSNVQILGGATTIFFEDDPFANFVEPAKTSASSSSTTVLTTDSPSSTISEIPPSSTVEEESSTLSGIELDVETELTTTEALSEDEQTTTTAEPITTEGSPESMDPTLANVVIKEIDPNDKEVDVNCIRTSQVFLTQLPKTVTQLATVVVTDALTSELKTEIRQQIQPTFDIGQATKYYCIQASQTQEQQLEMPSVVTNLNRQEEIATSTTEKTESEKEGAEEEKEIEENTTPKEQEITTVAPLIENTELNATESKTEQPDSAENDRAQEDAVSSGEVNENAEDLEDGDEEDAEEEEETSNNSDDEDDEEIELIYKTLYTTYTYLTTFFHDESTSISSHTEVVTNVLTSTLGISATSVQLLATQQTANLNENEINPSVVISTRMESTKRYMVPTEVESFIRSGEEMDIEKDDKEPSSELVLDASIASDAVATFYTTYTYYTTIFAEGETEIMSHTEVITNLKKSPSTSNAGEKEMSDTVTTQALAEKDITTSTGGSLSTTINEIKDNENVVIEPSNAAEYSTISALASLPANDIDIPDLGDLSAITLVTDVRSSSSPGNQQIINHLNTKKSSDLKAANDQILQSILEDQISSESNTDTDEIIPSATLLLQTSFTTFTYYTTMYSGSKTNVISRLETMTNTVTETLQASKTINLDEASIPITYFTTFTYWTKLAKEGQITTLSREETISNVVTPTTVAQYMSLETPIITNTESSMQEANQETTTTTTQEKQEETAVVQAVDISGQTAASTVIDDTLLMTSVLEPTTYYTTYTYYTTSYETDNTITDSRFETVTNIVTPTLTVTGTIKPEQNSDLPSNATDNGVHEDKKPNLILYDFKKIIDADGISTLYFTTQIEPTVNAEGLTTEVISSSSSLHINEEKKTLQATSTLAPATGPDGQIQKQYKTGLVRLIEGTRIGNRTTTLYQSKVIGTVIDQRYAQIIESTSSFIFEKTVAPDTVNTNISPTKSSSDIENISGTQQATISSTNSPTIEGSIGDQGDQEPETFTEADTNAGVAESEEDDNSKPDEKLRFPFQTKKRPFVPPLKSFSNRNRPQFAPKKNSSATIITRSDFTPTITATPALKTANRFASTRRGSVVSNASSPLSAASSSSRRFGRPSKSSAAPASQATSSTGSSALAPSSSRNRFAFGSSSSSISRPTFASSSRRQGSVSIRPTFSRPALFSTGFPGNSRLRVKPTATLDLGDTSTSSQENSTVIPPNSQEEEDDALSQDELSEDENATESNRRQNNPLLRLRRPLNRPQGFTPARAQSNSPNNAVSPRRNPLTSRARSSTTATTSTTTTQRPKPRTFQRPAAPSNGAQNRARPTNSLFPPRNIFGAQKPALTTEESKNLAQSEEDTNENDDDSEYEDDDDEESEGDDEDENNRRRRSNGKLSSKAKKLEKHSSKSRSKREADTSQQSRTNFRNRFRRPKLASSSHRESKSFEEDLGESSESASAVVPQTTPSLRTRSRFGARYPAHGVSSTTAAATSSLATNHRAIRPTRPTSNNGARAQFTLREKDSSTTTTTQKGLTSAKRPAFRRPQPAGGASTRRLPSSTASSTSSSNKRRLKSFSGNDAATSSSLSRNSATSRTRPSSTTGRSRSGSSRDSSVRGRGRGHNDYNNDPLIADNGGTITVTHVIPAEVTIPVITGKVTEYKQVVTAKTSTEVLGPHQYTTTIGSNGQSQLALTREDTSLNYNGATEVTQYVLHETATTTIIFTPTTIRGRKTSFSHVLPSTVYSVEQVVSTQQPQISSNAPLANILLSQLLLGNVGLNNNPLLGALGGALTQPALPTAVGPAQPATPVTEYKTHASTYVTTLFEGQSTILPITFQGKKILTTIFDTTAQTITATEFITDTIVTTPTIQAQAQPAVNSLLLQQLLLQQHLQQQQVQQPDPTNPLNAILNSVPPQLLLGGDSLQELEVSNNIRGSGQGDLINEDDELSSGSSVDLDDIALQAQAQTHKTGRKKSRKNGKSHKRKHHAESVQAESSVITLYVSGRRPGEFSTVLSTVHVRPDSTVYKRHAHTINSYSDYYNSEGSELINEYLAVPEIILLDGNLNTDESENKVMYDSEATQSLESIVGDVSQWYATQTTTLTSTYSNPTTQMEVLPNTISTKMEENNGSSSNRNEEIDTTSGTPERQFQHFDSGQVETNHEFHDEVSPTLKSSYDSELFGDVHQQSDIDEARYNLATRIMSNGVEVIIASDKTKTLDHILLAMPSQQLQLNSNKPVTLAASTIKNQMMILLLPSSSNTEEENQTQQLNINLPFHTNHFITKTCLTTYTYRTTYVQDGHTTVESREKVISNIATEERNYPKVTPSQTMDVTLTRTPELAVGIFPTTYLYYNTFKDNSNKVQVITSEHTVINTITGPDDYIAYLQPTAKATPVLETNTYYNKVILSQTLKPPSVRDPEKSAVGVTIQTVEKLLTQVIVTKSLPPARITSILTSYYTFDDGGLIGDSNVDLAQLSTAVLDSNAETNGEYLEKTKDLDDIHIYRTKIFLTTFTYYTTSVVKSHLTDTHQPESVSKQPLSTVFNYHTRVIENVITDSVPIKILPSELVSKMKLELRKQKHQQRLVIVTTATLKGGQTLKITAMNKFKPSIKTSASILPMISLQKDVLKTSKTTAAASTTSHPLVSPQELNEIKDSTTEEEILAENLTEEHYAQVGMAGSAEGALPLDKFEDEDLKQQEPYEGDADTIDSLSSEQIATIVEAPKNQTHPTKLDAAVSSAKPPSTANQLIQRLTALRPMFNAMADLWQNNFGVGIGEAIKPLKHIESKQAPNKQIMSNLTSDATHPIYIPVQKPSLLNGQFSPNLESGGDMPQSLHIQPPLVNEISLDANDKDNWLMPPLTTKPDNFNIGTALTAPRHEQPLHNGGIYIRPGEVITANSDVIIGKPNGIEYVQIPNQLPVDNTTNSNSNILDNRHYQVTYYQHNIQHPYRKKSPSLPQNPPHIPIGGFIKGNQLQSNNIIKTPQFGLRPPLQMTGNEHFNKNILKPPPLPHVPSLHSQTLHIDTQSGSYQSIPLAPLSSIPSSSTSELQSAVPSAHRIFLHSSMHKMSMPSLHPPPPHRGLQNFYHLNNELKNNEILEIKRIPEIFSTDLKPSSVYNNKHLTPTSINYQPTQAQILIPSHQHQNTENRENNVLLHFPKNSKFSSNIFYEKKLTTEKPLSHQISFNWEPGPSVNSPSFDEIFLKNLSLLRENVVTPIIAETSNNPPTIGSIEYSKNQQGTLKSDISKFYNNDNLSLSSQRINLDQSVFSHTVDVNVPPLTFNREDHDYPQQATAVRGQIPSSDKPLKTTQHSSKYMPLIKIPPNEQQVQVKLTPLNVIGAISDPVSLLPQHPFYSVNEAYDDSVQSVVTPEVTYSNSPQNLINPPLNGNFKNFEGDQSTQDQKTVATSNIIVLKSDGNLQKSWKNYGSRHQPSATTQGNNHQYDTKHYFLHENVGLKNKDIGTTTIADQRFKSTTKPNSEGWLHYKTVNDKEAMSVIDTKSQLEINLKSPDNHHKFMDKVTEKSPSFPTYSISKPIDHFTRINTTTSDEQWLESHNYANKEHQNIPSNRHSLDTKLLTPPYGDINKQQGNLNSFQIKDSNSATPSRTYSEQIGVGNADKTDNEIHTDVGSQQSSNRQTTLNAKSKASNQKHQYTAPTTATYSWSSKQPQPGKKSKERPKGNDSEGTVLMGPEIHLKKQQGLFDKAKLTATTTIKSPSTPIPKTETIAEDINKIIRTDEGNVIQEELYKELHVQPLAHGQGFRKTFNNVSNNNVDNSTPTKPAIFVAAGEAFRIQNTPTPDHYGTTLAFEQELQQPKEIFVTHETQHAKQSNVHTLKTLAKLASTDIPDITLKPLALDIQPPPLLKAASTETVVGLNPPPLPTLASATTAATTHKMISGQSLVSVSKIPYEARKRHPVKQQVITQKPLNVVPSQTLSKKPNDDGDNKRQRPTHEYKPKYQAFERPSTVTTTKTKTKSTTMHNNEQTTEMAEPQKLSTVYESPNKTLLHQSSDNNNHPTTTQEMLEYNLEPSETYDVIKTSTSRVLPQMLTITTTTTTTTTTRKRIVLPTKYITNKHIFTVTTTATPPSMSATWGTIKATTETTTATATLLVTQTEITTVVDTVTSVKTETLKPDVITATTTINLPGVATTVLVSSIPNSQQVPTPPTLEKSDMSTKQLPYPTVEIISTNITKEKAQAESSLTHHNHQNHPLAINPDENSIFIVMTNNKKNSLLKTSTSSTQVGNIESFDLETAANGREQEDVSNEVMIDYDDTISFDAAPPTRDEELIRTINGKSVASNGKNIIVGDEGGGSENNQILLGGVLIATQPKSPNNYIIDLNLNESISCRPECKATRNEVCVLVDIDWACVCRPGFARMFPDLPCKPTYTYSLLMHAERVGNYPLQYVQELSDNTTDHYKQLSQLLHNALDRMVMQSDFRDAYHGVHLTQLLDDHKAHRGIVAEFLLQLSDNSDEKRLEDVLKKHLRLSNFSIGGTDLHTNNAGVDALTVNDFNECLSRKFHDCSKDASCFNLQGTYTCSCREGFADLSENTIYPGRLCSSEQIGCEQCHYHGKCSSSTFSPKSVVAKTMDRNFCECFPWYTGAQCQVNLKILLIVLLGIGTLLFILLLFCILITCTKRRKHQHTALATSTMTSTSVSGGCGGSDRGGLRKNSRFATNLLITSVGVGLRGSIENGYGTNNKRQKSIKIDKRSMIKDSSSEASQNSLPYVLKNRGDTFNESCTQKSKSPHMSYSKQYSNYRAHINANDQYSVASNTNVGSQNNLNSLISSSFMAAKNQDANDSQLAVNAADPEGHYCEQSDRSLTVMIPRAKYHSSILPQTHLMHPQLIMGKSLKTSKTANEITMRVDNKNSGSKKNQKRVSSTTSFGGGDVHTQIPPSTPGALISAGFEVSAIVSDHTNGISSMEKQNNNDLLSLEVTPTHTLSMTTSDPATSVATNVGQKQVFIDGRQKFKSKKFPVDNFETESEYNVYKNEKDLIETMDEWLGNVKLNELSAEARSFDETTVRASTKPLHIRIDETQPQQLNDEANTMAERDIGSTFLLPHTHLYKPERQESEMSGFESF